MKTSLSASACLAAPGLAYGSVDRNFAELASAEASSVKAAAPALAATRGIGLYPGAPEENFDPQLVLDPGAPYGNLALLRPAFASSAYDFNLTAQLVTDGLTDTELPRWVTTLINGQIQPKHDREYLLDHFTSDVVEMPGDSPSFELHLGGAAPPEIDRVAVYFAVPETVSPEALTVTVWFSEDGNAWKQVGSADGGKPLAKGNYPPDLGRGSHLLAPSIPLKQTCQGRYFRVDFARNSPAGGAEGSGGGNLFRATEVEFYKGESRVEIGGPYHFTSAWRPASLDREWVYVDLGSRFPFDKVVLHWIARAAEGVLQSSDDAETWRDLQPLPTEGGGMIDTIALASPVTARYVRLLLTRPASEQGYILSEFEVHGHGGYLVQPKPALSPDVDGTLRLSGGEWRLHRVSAGKAGEPSGEVLSTPGFGYPGDRSWLVATVPGTELTSYQNVGAIPDPNFGQNQLHISDSFFYADFWYRTEFLAPAAASGDVTRLCFDGINWKAEVYLNGERLGRIDGGFTRGSFDVTGKLHAGSANALAVRVAKNDTPGSAKQKTFESTGKNGGALGADNPTYHASIGWDWIPTVRGRNTGIWADVTLVTTGPVVLRDPLVSSTLPLPDVSSAEVAIEVFAHNLTTKPISGTLHGRFGDIAFHQPVQLAAQQELLVKCKAFRVAKPELWWPNGYGEPHLYDVELRLEPRGHRVHQLQFKAGIRQVTADEDGGKLHLFVNGRRLVAKGGNWGFGEVQLRYRAREYDTAVRYHREQNFNMIRNWVGQIGDDAFYEACDHHGLVVWQDFWLANPWDGPFPNDDAMFLANARDFLRRIRRHPSLGLYCGRNEWFPPPALDAGLRSLLAELHPGLKYIGSSADGPVSGHGPYRALPVPFYFEHPDPKLHSELGAPNIPNLDSVRLMMPEKALWPQGLDWGLHDFTLEGAQGGTTFRTLVEEAYGGAHSAEEWTTLAQFINYDTYRAMFESQSKYRAGLLLWMSHCCWPSFVWQTYDYYFEPTAAYFGCKAACEPLHIQWNAFADTLEVVNASAGSRPALTAMVELINMDGKVMSHNTAPVESREDTTVTVMPMLYPGGLSDTHFVRLTLSDAGKIVSRNFYLRAREEGDFRAIRTLAKAPVSVHTETAREGEMWRLTTEVRNASTDTPALMVRLKVVRGNTGDRVLPVMYEDNYFALMPGESRTLKTELRQADARGEEPRVVVEGFNVKAQG